SPCRCSSPSCATHGARRAHPAPTSPSPARNLGIVMLLTATLLLPRPWLAAAERTLLAYSAAIPALVASFALLALVRSTANRSGR
ncbi:hypothetical protein, partial [Pseudoclavibacter helvolus]